MTVTRTRTVPQMTRSRGHPGEEDDGAGGRGLAEREQSGERLFDAHAPLTSRSTHAPLTSHSHFTCIAVTRAVNFFTALAVTFHVPGMLRYLFMPV